MNRSNSPVVTETALTFGFTAMVTVTAAMAVMNTIVGSAVKMSSSAVTALA